MIGATTQQLSKYEIVCQRLIYEVHESVKMRNTPPPPMMFKQFMRVQSEHFLFFLSACAFTRDSRLKQAQSCWLMLLLLSGNNKQPKKNPNSHRSCTRSCCRRPPPSKTVPAPPQRQRRLRASPSQAWGQRSWISSPCSQEGAHLCGWRWGGSRRDAGTEEGTKDPGWNSGLGWITTREIFKRCHHPLKQSVIVIT